MHHFNPQDRPHPTMLLKMLVLAQVAEALLQGVSAWSGELDRPIHRNTPVRAGLSPPDGLQTGPCHWHSRFGGCRCVWQIANRYHKDR